MTGSMKRGWVWVALASVAVGAFAAQAVYAQVGGSRATAGAVDPFSPSVAPPSDPGKISTRRPPTRDPIRPVVRSPFVP